MCKNPNQKKKKTVMLYTVKAVFPIAPRNNNQPMKMQDYRKLWKSTKMA